MPTPEGAAWQVATYAAGNRASWKDTNMTLSHMFDDDVLQSRLNQQTRAVMAKFKSDMMALSTKWRGARI